MSTPVTTTTRRADDVLVALARELERAAAIVPPSVSQQQVVEWTRWALRREPQLLACDPTSVINAVIEIVRLGLPVAVGGLTYLLPYRSDGRLICQPLIGWRGYQELARRHGITVQSQVIYQRDYCDITITESGATILHKPALAERADAIGVYAWARLSGGDVLVEVMSRPDVERIRRRSRAGGSGPWQTDWEEMSRKTVVRRLAKRLPQTPDLIAAQELDTAADAVGAERRPAAVASAAAAIRRAIEARAPEQQPQPTSPAPEVEAAAEAEAETASEPQPEPEPSPAPIEKKRLRVLAADGSVHATVSTASAWATAVRELLAAAPEDALPVIARRNLETAELLAGRWPEQLGELAAHLREVENEGEQQ